MKVETLQQTPKVSSAKLGIYCVIFCLTAGLVYGNLETMHYPVTPFAKGLIAFSNALFWGGAVVAFFMFKRGNKLAPLLLLFVYAVNVLVPLYAINVCGLRSNHIIDSETSGRVESKNIHPLHRMLRDDTSEIHFYDPRQRSNKE